MDALIAQPLHILGAGRTGRLFAILARAAGQPVASVVATTLAHAREAAALVGSGEPRTTLPADVSGIVLVALPDRLVTEVAAPARARAGRGIWLHTAGALGAGVLGPADPRAPRAAVHPLTAIADPRDAAARFAGTPCAFEADPEIASGVEDWVRALGGVPVRLAAGSKARYHAAAVLCANGAIALADAAVRILATCGLSDADARALIVPMLRANVENLAARPAAEALTGPVRRGDAATVAAHLASAGDWPAGAADLYRALLVHLADLAARGGTAEALLTEIRRMGQDVGE